MAYPSCRHCEVVRCGVGAAMRRTALALGCAVLAATIIAPAVTTPAASAEITRRPQANGPYVISIAGVIEPGDDIKFNEIASDMTQASVILDAFQASQLF